MSKSFITSLLRQCRSLTELWDIHAYVQQYHYDTDIFVANLLLQAYTNFHSPSDGFKLFLSLRRRNLVSWNIALGSDDHAAAVFHRMPCHSPVSCSQMITRFGRVGCVDEALLVFLSMPCRDPISWNAMVSVAGECLVLEIFCRIPQHGIISCHAMIQAASGVETAMVVFSEMILRDEGSWNLVIAAVAKCGHLEMVEYILLKMPIWSLIAWNTLIQNHVLYCKYEVGLDWFVQMPLVDEITCSAAVTALAAVGQLQSACDVFNTVPSRSVVSWTALTVAALRSGDTEFGCRVLEAMPGRTTVSWNALLQAFAKCGQVFEAQEVFLGSIPSKDLVSWNTMLRAFSDGNNIEHAREVFDKVPGRDLVTWNTMLQASCGEKDIFDSMPQRDVISWTIMVSTSSNCSRLLIFFAKMPQRNVVTWTAALQALTELGQLDKARACFDQFPQHSIVSWNAMLNAFGISEDPDQHRTCFQRMPQWDLASLTAAIRTSCSWQQAQALFDSIPRDERDLVVWNAMLEVYLRCGVGERVSSMFECMPRRDCSSLLAKITAVASTGDLGGSRTIFQKMPCHSTVSWNVMLTAASGSLKDAMELFHQMPHRDDISWNIMLTALVSLDEAKLALEMFCLMDLDGASPSGSSLAAAADACSKLSDSRTSRLIQEEIVSMGLEQDNTLVATALLRMLASCGMSCDARDLFQRLSSLHANPAFWTAMISATRLLETSAELAERMALEGIVVDGVTFSALLACCAHSGLVDRGVELLRWMVRDFDLGLQWNHYLYLVDALGRCGRVDEARELMEAMPYEPSETGWTTLLAACNSHGYVERGWSAGKYAIGDSNESGGYVLLFNTLLH